MICYVDSSVVLRHLLLQDSALEGTAQIDTVGSSELLIIECHRVLDRYRLENQITDAQLAEAKQNLRAIVGGLYIVELTEPVKTRAAGAFPTVVGTLDALHLASLLLWKEMTPDERFVLLSADRQMLTCAAALGISPLE
jgi:predicted nucleic acid-binding protein